MRIFGVDPGLKATGYGLIDYNNGRIKLLEAGTIEPKQKDLLQNRVEKIHRYLDELLKEYRPEVVVLEKLYSHHNHPLIACKLGHVRGVICLVCAQHRVDLVEHSVKRIRIALAGNGNATKEQTRRVVANTLNVDAKKLVMDASDALALALGYTRIHSRKL